MAKKSPLGRGLGALISDGKYQKKPVEEAVSSGSVSEIKIADVSVNPFQVRTEFDEVALKELSESIKQLGIIQPITVRKLEDGKFQLISGERRYRASKLAGLKTIIAFIRKANDQEMLEMALVENIQRENLNAIEIALSYKRLMDECSLTQDKMSERVGKKRSTISNYLRLLVLPPKVQLGIQQQKIGMGHARALVTVADEQLIMSVFHKVIDDGMSVRDTEKHIKALMSEEKPKKKESLNRIPENYRSFKENIQKYFPSKVELKRNNAGKGSLNISFKSDAEFEKIQELLNKIQD